VSRGRGGLLLGLVLASAASCAGQSDALTRGQRYYEDNQYEKALSLWRDLDRRQVPLSSTERARFAYLRGMTDYRLGFRDDARHWLAVAKSTDVQSPGGLDVSSRERLEGALGDLEREAFGIQSDGRDVVQTIEAPPEVMPSDPPHPGSDVTEPDPGRPRVPAEPRRLY
jgi:hypothetical protein